MASKSSTATTTSLSPRVMATLDPCVVLMKDLVSRYSHLWDQKGGVFSLAQGVVYWEPPSSCQEALKEEFSRPGNLLHTYGPAQGIPQLTEALTEKISQENGLNSHNVMVTVGANQAYVNCVLTCLCDDSKAVVFAPFYFNHVMAIQMCCGDKSVVIGPCSDQGVPDLKWLEETLQKESIDMVTIVNPGNPTGVSLSRETLQGAVDLCRKYSAWLVLDCTYEYFTKEEDQPIATFPNDSHVIHIFSFSKSYSLAGYRCGYLVMSKEKENVFQNMLKVQDTIPIGPPRVSQIAALGALQAGNQWVKNQYATLDESRKMILSSLEPLPTMGGSGAMVSLIESIEVRAIPLTLVSSLFTSHLDWQYVMAHLPKTAKGEEQDDVEICRQLVKDYGIAIIPATYCGFPGWIRVCYANLTPEMCLQAAERLQRGIQEIVLHKK
jgi:aspartate/methionine/tyrosine aminotransferase